jgi:hypothetical protein
MPKKKEQTVPASASATEGEGIASPGKRTRKATPKNVESRVESGIKPARKTTTRRTNKAKPKAQEPEALSHEQGSTSTELASLQVDPAMTGKEDCTSKSPSSSKLHAVEVTHEAISVRAYYLGEQRRASGTSGDSHGDWLEAERQLINEADSHWK